MAVADHQQAKFGAYAENQKAILPLRMLIIIEFNAVIIKEYRSGLFK